MAGLQPLPVPPKPGHPQAVRAHHYFFLPLPLPHTAPSLATPRATWLTFVTPHGKEGEDRAPIVSHAAQG